MTKDTHNSVRLDKWLWAARFFKTRSMAHEAIEGGKVYVDNIRAKPSQAVRSRWVMRSLSPPLEANSISSLNGFLHSAAPPPSQAPCIERLMRVSAVVKR